MTTTHAHHRHQSPGEEVANALSHGLGAVFAAVLSPQLVARAFAHGEVHGLAAAVFCVSMVLLFSVSAVYHWLPAGRAKELLRRLDHAAIFLFIAGSYTPFMLGALADSHGMWVLTVIWAVAGVGTVAKCINRLRHPVISMGMYMSLGWVAVVILQPLLERLPSDGVQLIFAGGVLYTLGAVFFQLDHRIRYGHFIWHLLVLAASGCHFVAVLHYAVI
jgi:hemolysin III